MDARVNTPEAESSRTETAISVIRSAQRSDRAAVLVVDDRAENRLALRAILEPLGHLVVEAASGEEALRRVLERDFAVILLDVQMPGLDGFETARLIKSRERNRHTPIVFLTALGGDDSRRFRGYEVGAVDYLGKPFDPEVLRAKVQVFVQLHESRLRTAEAERREHDLRYRAELAEAEARAAAELRAMAMELAQQRDAQQFAAEASQQLAESLDFYGTLATLSALVVPKLADWYVVYLIDEDGSYRLVEFCHRDPHRAALGAELAERYPPDASRPDGVFRALRNGESLCHRDLAEELLPAARPDGEYLRLLRSLGVRSGLAVPLRARGEIVGAMGLYTTESDRCYTEADLSTAGMLATRAALALDSARVYRTATRAAHRAGSLYEITAQLARAFTIPEVASVLVEQTARAVGASASAFAMLDGEMVEVAESVGIAERTLTALRRFPVSAPLPIAEALRTGEPVYAESSEELLARFPSLVREMPQPAGALVTLPLEVGGRASAALSLHFDTPRDFGSEIRAYLVTFARQGALALERVRLLGESERARAEATFLAESGRVLAESLDPEATLDALVGLAVPGLADWCTVGIGDPDGTILRAAYAHTEPEKVRFAEEVNARFPVTIHDPQGPGAVFRTGRPELVPEIPEDFLPSIARGEEHLRLLRALGLRSYVSVPLVARGSVLGVFSLYQAESGRRFGERDLALAQELARRAALALENARLYEEAEAGRRAAETANVAKSQFLATMSHELRTPLNAIAGYADLLEMGIKGTLSDGQHEYLRRIQRAQRHLLGLIDDVLSFAKLEAGRLEFRPEDVLMRDVLEGVETLIEPQARAKGIGYRRTPCDPMLAVHADPDKLRQVLLNLLSNAVKFTDPGGIVEVGWAPRDEWVDVTVSDTGVGLPADKLEQVFEPFVQAEQDLNRNAQGTGLGLSISRGFVRAMGGDLTARSVLGSGSTFTIRLPAAAAEPRLAGAAA